MAPETILHNILDSIPYKEQSFEGSKRVWIMNGAEELEVKILKEAGDIITILFESDHRLC